MTPEQTSVIFSEHNAMNTPSEEGEGGMVDIMDKKESIIAQKSETLDDDTGKRLRAEFMAKIGKAGK